MGAWHPTSIAPNGVIVETKIDDERGERNVQLLRRDSRLWFVPDGSMYVYYTPTHWRHASADQMLELAGEEVRKAAEHMKRARELRSGV